MCKEPLLLIISGPPCTGKSTLGKKIAEHFNLPIISKDDIKELLFNTLGWSDREWSRKVGIATYGLLYYFIEKILITRKSYILESNFKKETDSKKFKELKKRTSFQSLQILCSADGKVLLERFKKRSESGERHPGHVDTKNYSEFEETLLKGKYEPLEIDGPIIEIDTTDFLSINYQKLFEQINSSLTS